ncbi:long-chain-fatty-acid--CoA ligase 4-like isoform X2 [Asterias amurensis]|uniref:long-chain-fatty-acid--CoA ligase 4-like isoform X2 n=1 Tax=Asterias amurensis TaxID=7602 RepID=UPI003AB1555B
MGANVYTLRKVDRGQTSLFLNCTFCGARFCEGIYLGSYKMPDGEPLKPFYVSVIITLLTLVTWLYDIITYFPCYLASSVARERVNRTKAVNVGTDGSGPYRDASFPDELLTHRYEKSLTLDAEFERATFKFDKMPCLGTREVYKEEDEMQPNGKSFKKLVMGDYVWQSYEEVFNDVVWFGRGLHSLGLGHKENVLIFSETRAEFLIGLQAGFRYGFPVVTLYATLGEDAIIHGINETQVSTVITSASLLPKFKAIHDRIPSVKNIIYMDDQISKVNTDSFSLDFELCSFQSVIERGKAAQDFSRVMPTPDDLAVIMYTSGSTGVPKGVMISHRNIMSMVAGAGNRIPHSSGVLQLIPDETCVCFLPLAHILEVVLECTLLSSGYKLGYSSALTMTDISSKIKKGSKGDVTILKPTIMAAVPLIFDRLYKGVLDKVNSGSAIQRALFKFALDYKMKHVAQGFDTPIFNKLVFSKLRKLLGGEMRFVLTGGAALSHSAQRFMQCCFCVSVAQGYGLTETCGAGTIGEPGDYRTRHVGQPISCCEIKLKEWKEGNYTPEDKPNPRGEILIGGGNVAMGYYKNEALTEEYFETINGRRWFHTGDIGEVLANGTLRLIDRKKDLVKLQTGEYISLATIETVLKKSPFVENICVYADGDFDYCTALVVPYRKNLESAALEQGLSNMSFEDLCDDIKMQQVVLVSMAKTAKEGKLQKWEVPRKVKLCSEVWMPESGLITDAFKLKRRAIADHYKDDLKGMYYGK